MRKYVGMALTYRIEVEEIEPVQDPGPDWIDLTGLVFKWCINDGPITTVTPVRISAGHYEVTITPPESGTLYWRWEGDASLTFKTVKEGFDRILPSAFETKCQAYA